MDGGDLTQYVRFFAALVFVLSLMGGLALLMKKLGLGGAQVPVGNRKRLKITEVLPLDSRRRAVILRRDETEHLIILGPNGETVVETGIEAKDETTSEQ